MRELALLTIRIHPRDIERLDRIAQSLPGGTTRTGLARDILVAALDRIEKDTEQATSKMALALAVGLKDVP